MAAFLRALSAAAALPAAAAAVSLSSSSSSSSSSLFPSRVYSPSPSSLYSSSSTPKTLAPATRNPSPRPFATVSMVSPSTELKNPDQRDGALQELLTEFMVDMKCEGCVSSVKSNLQKLDGIKNVDVDLSNQVVRVLGSLPVKTMLDALEQTGRSARLIGQGNPNDFLISAAVAEFKGPVIFGVVRLAQVTMELARIEASFSGLSPGKHGWSINEFGDLTRGAASTGKVFNRPNHASEKGAFMYIPLVTWEH
ncbi:copper chaperone for superoxide dismutase, chloroplastic isoform X2 [Ananas comosus]|uniref:Superoxide dismutase copper chaperone n=1 Tax=Ananas comosus TaxID=4615 RepID=A0A6P5FLM0_ANACO|nr:copper chaperone for superoxide dismutase, chloroplastic isoform X2 [Ananas comosus]